MSGEMSQPQIRVKVIRFFVMDDRLWWKAMIRSKTLTVPCDDFVDEVGSEKDMLLVVTLVFGFDTAEEVEAAAARVRACVEFQSTRLALGYLSHVDGDYGERDLGVIQ